MKKKSRGPSLGIRILKSIFYVVFLLIFLVVGTGAGWLGKTPMGRAILSNALHPKPPEEVFKGEDSITLLILGCDEDRYFRGTKLHGSSVRRKYARADMILVAKLDFKNNRISGVSIPRDTRCDLDGYKPMKINGYYSNAPKGLEEETTKQAVEHLLPGVTIDRVVTLDFDAMQEMVNAVGGVKVNIDKKMKYDDVAGDVHINFVPGPKLLNGYDAMMFVRFRHDDSDFARQARQKQFLAAFKNAVVGHPTVFPQVAQTAVDVLNHKLSEDEICALAFFARRVPEKEIQLGQIQVKDGVGTTLLVDEDKLPATLQEYGLEDNYSPSASTRR